MRRRRPGLVRAALRLGFLTVVAGAAWYAYDVAVTDVAQAGEKPPAAVGDERAADRDEAASHAADLVRGLLAPVLRSDPPVLARPPRDRPPPAPPAPPVRPPRADPPPPHPSDEPAPPVDAGPAGRPAPAGGQPRQDAAPPADATTPAGQVPPSTGRSAARPKPTSPRVATGTPHAAPPAKPSATPPSASRPDDPSARPPALPEAEAGPLTAVLAELLGPASPLPDSVVAGTDPVLRELTPVLDPLEPVLDVLEPVVELPQPAPTPADPTPHPNPDPTMPPAPAGDPTPPAPGAEPARPGSPDRIGLGPGSARPLGAADHRIRHLSDYPAASLSAPDQGAVDGGQHDRNRQADSTPDTPPSSPAPGTSGAEPAPNSHSGTADLAAAGWSPPPVSGRVTRSTRDRRQPSRSPRPRSRPA
ncbi:hypothetical protein ENC19_09550 [Verrucosispora sp. CWR15]|uniref:Uncharacterized protein n=1 Tax=Verrucosispora sioxanthis TaxID=2499994 RepID=A0A6M1KZ06_9ACTN|nr:hypothetical protein [Verrucosispora sioxanthis]NEE63772.1 hypothetical protein [Verrucosispora sioxanthis]NGM12882.1 hypothetical protein [Verrucosispora sioxanthis]